jgi:hypothetical protein
MPIPGAGYYAAQGGRLAAEAAHRANQAAADSARIRAARKRKQAAQPATPPIRRPVVQPPAPQARRTIVQPVIPTVRRPAPVPLVPVRRSTARSSQACPTCRRALPVGHTSHICMPVVPRAAAAMSPARRRTGPACWACGRPESTCNCLLGRVTRWWRDG